MGNTWAHLDNIIEQELSNSYSFEAFEPNQHYSGDANRVKHQFVRLSYCNSSICTIRWPQFISRSVDGTHIILTNNGPFFKDVLKVPWRVQGGSVA